MTHAGRCSLCFSRQGKHSLGLPFMTIKIVSMDKPKSNRLCGIFKMPLSSLFWLTARVLRSSFERQTNQRCLIPLVKAIRVRARILDSLVARDPDHFLGQLHHSHLALRFGCRRQCRRTIFALRISPSRRGGAGKLPQRRIQGYPHLWQRLDTRELNRERWNCQNNEAICS